ncbi:MAG TPA: NADH-quinone oxidoreductase subunit NuoG [Actinomycetota bacterium]|nr:NADH-quinone oxidoreductase subunit NuoG [Actinomycetota bacterium]
MTSPELVTLTVNGREVRAEKGRVLIDVAEELGIFVPRFCYHPGMKSVAVCRMCLVRIEGTPKLVPACATPVAEGMVASTVDPDAVDAQEGMLEFLLINHPLDCPICDRGGECPLQDQTYRHGPGASRYVEPKRTFEKALEISDLVVLDRERCVLCWRCVRFSQEISGDPFIQLVDRGPGTQILTFNDEPFDSYFSGNTVQICPVGALTSRTYRFVSRPWDLKTAPSVCAYCSVGCPVGNDARADKLVRVQALPNENVNDFWICDKGRYAFHYVDSDERITTPLRRGAAGSFETASWADALADAAELLRNAQRTGVIAGGHVTTEDAYAVAKLARDVLETPNVDGRVQDAGAPYELALRVSGAAGSTATLNDVAAAKTIVWVGPDPKETLPVLYLRLRKAVVDGGAQLVVVSPRRMSLDGFATRVIRCAPGGEADEIARLRDAGPAAPLVACWGPASPGRDETDAFTAVLDLVAAAGGRLLTCPPHAGSQGLIDMGVHPALAPGYERVEEPGMDTRAMLEAAAAGELDALVLVGADPIADFPDAALARRALESVALIAIELFPTESAQLADVLLPSVAYSEREGTFTNLERRIQKLEPLTAPPGAAREPWRALASLAAALGRPWDWDEFDDVWAEIRARVATHADVDHVALAQQLPPAQTVYESAFEDDPSHTRAILAGAGGHYPRGFRAGAPFQTGQNWPLSWELRAFEAKQRPGVVPAAPDARDAPEPVRRDAPERARGDGRLGLVTGRMIYDAGTMVSKTAALAALTKPPFVELNAGDAERLGVADGDDAVVAANGTELRVKVRVGDVAAGVAFVPYDQPGARANTLMSGDADPAVTVRRA